MATKNSITKSRTARPNYIALGTDAEGRHHCFCGKTRTVIVVRDRQRVHVEDLSSRHVDAWMDYVRARTGWRNEAYGIGGTDFEVTPWGTPR